MTELYLITPPAFSLERFSEDLAAALDAGPVACVQLRMKNVTDDHLRRVIGRLRPVVQARDVAFFVNDRADLAREMGCDGVHLGQEDLQPGGVAVTRQMLGSLSFGITCHDSRHLAIEAAESGADYVAFGAFFPTNTKKAKTRADVQILSWWSEMMEVPCVAIGGITPQNSGSLVRAGANFLAVIGAVWEHVDGPAAGVRAMLAAISEAE